MPNPSHGFDPALFHEDGRLWQRFAGIVVMEPDRDTLEPVGDTHLVLAEGGTGWEHGVRVARAKELTGPYELDERPLLTTRDDPAVPLQKAGHGELVDTP
ncbi:family 43 glycosylhydrolase [Streptomyces massasporeus]|uniref:family 43 glycosylhydrolase n=1 Tax=Streptomyces massasporeus TaxID=67324 RepID=UPI003656DCC0